MTDIKPQRFSAPPIPPVPPGVDKPTALLFRLLDLTSKAVNKLGKSTVDIASSVGTIGRHAFTHLATGTDPLRAPGDPEPIEAGEGPTVGVGPGYSYEDHLHAVVTAAPSNPTGTAAAAGTGLALMRADATIMQGIVTTKGDILTHSATVPARLPVGANGTALVADSTTTTGLRWSDDSELLAWLL